MWNIRMRASKKIHRRGPKDASLSPASLEIHISGAEGMYEESEMPGIVSQYAARALYHEKGRPDIVVISLEAVPQPPHPIQSLPVSTLSCRSPHQARALIRMLLTSSGISDSAIRTAFTVTHSTVTMRGASLVLSGSGRRVEPDKERGIRASRLGITRAADKILSRKLSGHGLNTATVKEALILASKVAACDQVKAELCISDDPAYTTGYVSSKQYGYVRIPHIKKRGGKQGGRVFFLDEGAEVASVTGYLEREPVIITNSSPCYGVRTIDEIIDSIDR
jgi:6-carboxyhexanoate--CoA ligase